MKKVINKALAVIVIVYSSLVLLLWISQWVLRKKIIGSGIVKSLSLLILFPSLLLLPLCLMMRQQWLAFALAPNVVALLNTYGPFLVPRTKKIPATNSLRLLTFNLETPGEQGVAALIEIIEAVDADLVALQELSHQAAHAITDQLGAKYPHQALHSKEAFAGQGVLSRYPIQADEYWQYDKLSGSLGHQRVVVMIGQRQIVLYNIHAAPPVTYKQFLNASAHRESLQRLMDEMASEDAPLLLAGDFNMTEQFHSYRLLNERYTDAFREVGEVGFGFTFPNKRTKPFPAFLRLDYIFYDKAFQGIRAKVWPDSGPADHAPLLADLVLTGLVESSD